MAQEFMNTQTGGEGETIQLQTDIKSTPEQFDVKLPQQAQEGIVDPSNPAPQPATVPNEGEVVEQPPIPFAPTPTQTEVTEEVKVEPIAPTEPEKKPTEPQKQGTTVPFAPTKIETEILPSSISMFSNPMGYKSEADANNPYVKNASLLTPTIDVINVGEIVGQNFTEEDDSDIVFQSESEREAYEEQKQFDALDPSVQSYVQAVAQTPPVEDPTIKKMNEVISKGKAQGGYDGILERVAQGVEDESTFGDVDVPTVKFDKLKVSSNYNNWANIMGVTEDQIDEMATGAIINQQFEDKANTIGNLLSTIDQDKTNINYLEESLNSGVLTSEAHKILSYSGPTWIQPGGKIDKSTKYQITQSINALKKDERVKRKELIDVNNQLIKKEEERYIPPQAPVTKLQEFENRTNTNLKSIYSKKWEFVGKDQGIPFYKAPVNLGLSSDGFAKDNISTPTKIKEIKDQAKWLDQEGRELIQKSVATGNPNLFFNNPEAKNLNPGLTEYARDLFEVEYNKDFKKNGNVDPYTYDGFKRTAAKMARENSTKLNSSIADNANDVVQNVTELNDKWVGKNQKILTTKINQVKTSMDEVLSGQIMSEIQNNPQAAAIRDNYSQLISVAPSKEEAAKLNDQMMSELKQIPAIGKAFGEYKDNLDSAVFKLQADYNREWYSFRQDLYNNSVNDLKNKIGKTTKEIYRGGVNNDLNLYQGESNVKDPDKIPLGADGVVKSQKFKQASYYEKRKMISNQWEVEKAAIINYTNNYIKRNVEKYPVNKEESAKHWSEWTGYRAISDKQKNQWLASMPERTGADAKNRYVFYAVDDLLYPNNSKPTVFGIKSFADAELDKIKYLEEKFGFKVGDHIGDYGDTRAKLPISQKEEEQLLSTKKMLNEILSHPETDQEWYTELLNGASAGFDIPILGAFVGIQRNQNLRDAMDRYQDGTFDSFDISMTEAQAALNKLNEIRPPSTAYQIGAGVGFTSTFMLEMAMTGGVNQIGGSLATKAVQTVANIAKSSADDVARVAAERAAPETIQRIEKIAAFLGGGMAEGASSPRAYESFTENMLQNVTVQELGTFDGLVAQFDNTSKNEFNEFFKAYGNWIGMATIERLGGHLPMTNVTKEVLEYMGTETFIKRSMVGAWFRSAGFKSVDEASEFIATTSMPWSGITRETAEELIQGSWESIMYGEQIFGPEKQADGTKEIKFFGMTPDEIQVTAASVAIFGAGSTIVQNARASISGDNVTIEAQDIDGTSQIVQIDKQSWNKFNGIVSDPNLSWESVSKMLEQSNLTVEQQRAMATVFIKTRGLEILADKDYQKWKEDNKAKIEQNKELLDQVKQKLDEEENKLTEEEKGLRDYQFMTTGLQYDNEGKPMNFWESLNAKDNMWMSINMIEDQLADANMPIVEINEDGEKVETNTRDNAEAIVKKKKKADTDKEKTPKGKKTTKVAKPSKTEEAPSTTETVEPINTEVNDQENQTGLPSQVGEGQESVEEQPIVETSEETVSPSGVVQEEQKITVNPSQGYSFEYASESEIPSELRSVNPISKSESQKGRGKNASKTIRLTFSGQQLIDAGLGQQEQAQVEAPVTEEVKVEETKAPEVQKKSPLDEELDSAIIDMENIQEEIEIEKGNIKEEKERIKEEKAKVRASKMSRAEKQDKLEDLDEELKEYIENAEASIEYAKMDLKDAKSRVKKIENRKAKEETVAETKTEPTPVEPVAKEEAPEYEAKEAPKKMVAPGRTKQAFDRNFTIEISADGTTATVQGEAIETADGKKLTPPKETAKITTNINGERVAITSKGDTVYLDRAKEVEEVKEVEAEGKTPQQIRDEYMEIARQSNGDYAIVYSRTNEPLVHKLNRATGRWQALNSKGEWVDANDNRNAQANDAVNYTRKDRKEVDLNGEKFYFDFKNNSWKKYSESDGSLSSISKEEADRVQEKFVLENPKRAAKKKAVNKAKQETRDAIGENMTPDIESTLNSKEFEDGVEVVEAPTAETETKKKPKKGNRHMATQRRGAAVGFASGLIEQLEKVFPNLSRISGGLIVDQGAFNNIAGILGASPYAAALLHDGVIYLNPSVANGNTAFEEYAHVYLMAIEQINPSLYNRGLALVEQSTEYIDEVVNDAEYAYIHGNKKYEDLSDSEKKKVQFEALSKMIADRAEKVFDDRRKSPITTWIKELWQTIARVFKIGSLKLDLSRSSIDDYVKGIAKQLNRNSPISMISKDQLADLMEGDLSGVTVSRSVASPQSPASHWLRTNFFANKGLQENEAYRLKQARRDIQVWQNRVKDTVNDLNQAVKDYVKATGKNKVDVLLDVNQSLSDPVKRADWFSSDAQAEAMIKPVIESMRNQIDMLQAKLAASGLFNEDLTATITGNNDVYVNTSYYAFSGRNYKGDWMNLFSEAERNQILDWVYNGAYQTASKLNYKVSPTGGVEVTFQNGFGIETESLNFNNMNEFKQFLKDNAKLKLNGAPINLRKVKLGSGQGSLDFYAPMDISDAGIKFNANEAAIYGHLNEIVKDRESLSAFVHTQKSLTSSKAKSALKKKKNLDETYKLFLREIKDPATNYANTIAKQSEILYKGMMEQGIIDSGYLASKKASGNNTVLISDPGSRLRGYYVSPELNRFLNDRTPSLLDIVSATPVNIFDRAKNKKMSTMGMAGDSLISVATAASSFTKAYLTVLSIGSNAANYISGYFQLFKTGNMPFGMTSAMRALEQGFSSQKVFSKENSVAAVLNTVPTIIRAISNIANNSAMYNKGGVIGALSEDQKKYFGVSDFSQLTSQQKAKVLLEELTSTGVIGTNIDVEMLRELTETAFDNTIPDELVQGKIAQILGKAKQFKGDTWEAITASYAFSDSMFKAVMYLQEKQKNLDTYGSVLAKQGISPEVIEERMREKTAIDVRKQMPTYDRSPDIIKALSKFPLIGTFIQFDFQSKVNDKNIIVDIFKMAKDSSQMRKEGYSEEANKLMIRSAGKLFSLGVTSTISMAIYNIVNSFISGFKDDDDQAIRSLLPEYRKYNMMLHLDDNKKGLHTYLDLSRIDPQTLYTKYYRALTEDGFDAMADELLKPYYTQDIFVGGLAETLMNLDKYGEASATIEKMSFIEKLEYFVSERILPSGVVGQVSKLLDAIEGGEASPGIDKDPIYELMNMYFGMKPRTIDIGKEYSAKIKFEHFDKIQGEHKVEFQDAKKELKKVQDQFDRGKTTKENLNKAKMNLEEARVQANKDVADELKSSRELTNKMRRLGYSDEEIRKILTDNNVTRYMINILLDPSLKAEFDSEGKIGAGKPAKKPKKNSMYDVNYNNIYNDMYPSMY